MVFMSTKENVIVRSQLSEINENINNDSNENNPSDVADVEVIKKYGIGQRHLQVFLLFLGFGCGFSVRANLSVGIVAMVNSTHNPLAQQLFQTYDWDEPTRGLILSSFFWGYIASSIPAGILSQKFGSKVILFWASIVCSVITLLTPLIADQGWKPMCASRVVVGLMQGTFAPCIHTLLAKWVHPIERAFLVSITYSGGAVGTILMMGVSGKIASTLGWSAIFYISGGATLLWPLAWCLFGCNSPTDCKAMTTAERLFIESIPGNSNKKKSIPWCHILKSIPFASIVITHCAANWGYYTLQTEMPSYINGVMHFNLTSNAVISALPYVTMLIINYASCFLSDFLTSRHYLTISTGRKLFNTFGMWGPMICFLALCYITQNVLMGIFLLVLAVGLSSSVNAGFAVNFMDLSPNFAGTLMGISHFFANIMSIMGPIFVGYVVTDTSDPWLWKIFFFVTAGINFAGNLIFLIFCSGDTQYWNDMENYKKCETPTSRSSTQTVDTDVYLNERQI